MSDRFGRRRLIAAGWLLYALVYAGFGYFDSPAVVVMSGRGRRGPRRGGVLAASNPQLVTADLPGAPGGQEPVAEW